MIAAFTLDALNGIDHGSINALQEGRCKDARVLPALDLKPTYGSIEFYARTAHIADLSRRFAVACELRRAMKTAREEVIMGGDHWFKPVFAE